MPSKKILVVEDDPALRELLRLSLAQAGYQVIPAEGARIGLELFHAQTPDLAILDVGLPDGDGWEVCQRIRAHKTLRRTPVILLTGRRSFEDKATGFEMGADQYLVKPVSAEEVLLWVNALLRRLGGDIGEDGKLRVADMVIDLKAHSVAYKDQVFPHLTNKELDLLYFLAKKRPEALSRKFILSNLWHTIAVEAVVDVYVSRLRKKLPPGVADKIQTVPGKGYRFFE